VAARSSSGVAAESVKSAARAGLRHVDDRRPGIRRHATGKTVRAGRRRVAVFAYIGPDGRAVHDAATLERIRRLAVPPAWTDVWICPLPTGHVQATGRDARGRKQYRYHARWRATRDENKYGRMTAFARALPRIRARVAADLRRAGLPREKVLATVVKLLETTHMRVGNEEYARANASFGLTTLLDRHVEVSGTTVRFRFRGKSGVHHETSIADPRLARIVRSCRDIPGQELFQYRDRRGHPHSIDSADVNGYLRDAAGDDFSAKDFRTWTGTVLAALALCEIARADAARRAAGGARRGVAARAGDSAAADGRGDARRVARAIAAVAQRLGNTPAVCRKSYVHPAVIASYMDGDLEAALAGGRRARQGALVALPVPGAAAIATKGTGLAAHEVAVLRLLQRRQSTDARRARAGLVPLLTASIRAAAATARRQPARAAA
jgi:DNA topoisomerase I